MSFSQRALVILGGALIVMPRPLPAQSSCSGEIAEVQRGLRAFDQVAKQLPDKFPRADGLEAYLGAAQQGYGGQSLNRLRDWTTRLSEWEQGVAAYETCLGTTCSTGALIAAYKNANPDLGLWLETVDSLGPIRARAESRNALSLLRDYVAKDGSLAGPMGSALTCLAGQAPVASPGLPATPATQAQGGLRWDLDSIPACGGREAFRFSLCEGRYLEAGQRSRPCLPGSQPSTVSGGHNAPYVFSTGHNTFLPKGMSIDGDGVLHGSDCRLLKKGAQLPICVRQLDVETCQNVGVGVPGTRTAAASKGGHTGLAIVGLGLAAGGVALGASALKSIDEAGGGSCSVTRTTCCGSGTGGQCAIPRECSCPAGVRDDGICSPGTACARNLPQSIGQKLCSC